MPFSSQWFSNPSTGDYTIDNSLILEDVAGEYLDRDFGSPTDQNKWSLSFWFKRTKFAIGTDSQTNLFGIVSSYTDGNNETKLVFYDDASGADTIKWNDVQSGSGTSAIQTTQIFRDCSAWSHFLMVYDSDQGTEADRIKWYLDGTQITALTTTYPDSGVNSRINTSGASFDIGRHQAQTGDYYIAEVIFSDGQALSVGDLGEVNSTTGQWVPKNPSGITFGNNGFWLKFGDSSALGTDSSGNSNTFTNNNIVAAQQSLDTPTSNHCTLNYVASQTDRLTLSNGNLKAVATNDTSCYGTMGVNSGKWYYEILCGAIGSSTSFGLGWANGNASFSGAAGGQGAGYIWDAGNGKIYNNSTSGSTYSGATAPSAGERVMCALDLDNGFIYFGLEGTWFNSGDPTSGATGTGAAFSSVAIAAGSPNLVPAIVADNGDTYTMNFGASSFTHTIPTGYGALKVNNLSDPSIADPSAYFQPRLYEGNGSTKSVDQDGNSDFEPDLVIIKNRDEADSWVWTDSVRLATKVLSSDTTGVEDVNLDTLTAFESDGFALGDDVLVNTNTENYCSWMWLESATAGFDIVADEGTDEAHTIPHSLSSEPEFIIRKKRTSGTDDAWIIWHTNLGGANYYLNFDSGASDTSTAYWNDTAPTSSVFSVGASDGTNEDDATFITYLFRSVVGFSKFGKYTGNGSEDGTFINLGFKPSAFIIKCTAAGTSWFIWDSARNTYNVMTGILNIDANGAETVRAPSHANEMCVDFVSNGVKMRNDHNDINGSSRTYIYAAWAESPFRYATSR